MKKYFKIQGIDLAFDVDDRHPWPYHEGLSGPNGMHFVFAIPKEVRKKEIADYKRKLKNERDVTGIDIYRV